MSHRRKGVRPRCSSSKTIGPLAISSTLPGLDLRDITTLYPICSTLPKSVTTVKLVEMVRRCLEFAEEEP